MDVVRTITVTGGVPEAVVVEEVEDPAITVDATMDHGTMDDVIKDPVNTDDVIRDPAMTVGITTISTVTTEAPLTPWRSCT